MYSMTHASLEETMNNQNYVTATSFGPTKQGSLLKNPLKEAAVNTSNDYGEVEASSVAKGIDAVSTSEEAKS